MSEDQEETSIQNDVVEHPTEKTVMHDEAMVYEGKIETLYWMIDWAVKKLDDVDHEEPGALFEEIAYKRVIAAARNRMVEIELGIDE